MEQVIETNNITEYRLNWYALMGKGYVNGYYKNFKGRYRAYKGARNTKKSHDIIGYEVLDKIISDPRRNVLILRNVFATHKSSTFAKLVKLINHPVPYKPEISFASYFKINTQELTITYIPTGQVILFRGFDNPEKIASIEVISGYLTDVYVEEAFELKSKEQWVIADGSFRGNVFMPNDLFIQITFCFNAWSKNHWLYEWLFKGRLEDDYNYLLHHTFMDYKNEDEIVEGGYGKGLYLHISTYKINEFRHPDYDIAMEEMRQKYNEGYKVVALGMWGNASETTYPEFNDKLIIANDEYLRNTPFAYYSIGIDTGFSDGTGKVKYGKDVKLRSATTMQLIGITQNLQQLIAIDEYFYSNEANEIKKGQPELVSEMIDTIIKWCVKYNHYKGIMKGQITVYVDSADIGTRQALEVEARNKGLFNCIFMSSTKAPIISRVDYQRMLHAYGELLYCNQCKNLIRETRNARAGEKGEVREDIDDHALTAFEYAYQPYVREMIRYKQYKEH